MKHEYAFVDEAAKFWPLQAREARSPTRAMSPTPSLSSASSMSWTPSMDSTDLDTQASGSPTPPNGLQLTAIDPRLLGDVDKGLQKFGETVCIEDDEGQLMAA